MSDTIRGDAVEPLRFDRAVPAESALAGDAGAHVVCTRCQARVDGTYFSIDGAAACAACRDAIVRETAPVREWGIVARAVLFGFGAAVAGAIVYYGVIAITELEIGFVAILIGYMVGWAVRRGARGRGGRRLQVAAAVLTYVSVSLAYVPLAVKEWRDAPSSTTAAARGDSSAAAVSSAPSVAPAAASATATSTSESSTPLSFGGVVLGLGTLALFALALPVLVIFGSMPSGLISAFIIGIGLRQAWRMTDTATPTVHGPYRVGADDGREDAPAAVAS